MRKYSGAIILKRGRVALQLRDVRDDIVNAGRITAFGGVAEVGEGAFETFQREFYEELKFRIDDFRHGYIGLSVKTEEDGTKTECTFYAVYDDADIIKESYEGAMYVFESITEALNDERVSDSCKWALTRLDVPERSGFCGVPEIGKDR